MKSYSPEDCKYKWFSLQISKKQKYNWSTIEDDLLKSLVISENFLNYGRIRWELVAKELNKQLHKTDSFIRLSKHCRERWVNHLDPQMTKNKWTIQEDLILFQKYLELPKKWSQIAKDLKGRTDNSIKNRFNKLIRMDKLNETLYDRDLNEKHLIKIKQIITEIKEVQNNCNNLSLSFSDDTWIDNENSMEQVKFEQKSDYSQENKEKNAQYYNKTTKSEKRARDFYSTGNYNEEPKWKVFLKEIEQINMYEKRDYLFMKQ